MNKDENLVRTMRILVPGDLGTLPRRHVYKRTHRPVLGGLLTTVRICICCGEPMVERGNALSRNPNVCASCSRLADGMEAADETKVSNEILP